MSEVYLVQDQHGNYWSKSGEWLDGSDPRSLARYRHRDEAVNTLVELNAHNVNLRGIVLAAALGERGEPVIDAAATSAVAAT